MVLPITCCSNLRPHMHFYLSNHMFDQGDKFLKIDFTAPLSCPKTSEKNSINSLIRTVLKVQRVGARRNPLN